MNVVRYYHRQTGVIHPKRFYTSDARNSEKLVALNAPDGDHEAIVGKFDHLSQRIDPATKSPVDYQPPAPSDDHEWHAESRRWRLKQATVEQRGEHLKLRARLAELVKQQHHHVRRALLGRGGYDELRAIDAEIDQLQEKLK